MPTQLDYLGSTLENHGIQTECLDLGTIGTPCKSPTSNKERAELSQRLLSMRTTHLTERLEDGRYDLVGFSFRNLDLSLSNAGQDGPPAHFLQHFVDLVTSVKALPNRPVIVAGGPGFSLFPEEILAQTGVDYGIVGAGEAAFPYLIDQLNSGQTQGERIIRRAFDFSGARYQRGYIPLEHYFYMGVAASIQTKRGCDALCRYCNYPTLEGVRYQLRPAGVVVDEMEQLIDVGFRHFYFTDAVFNWPVEQAKAIMKEIVQRRLDVRLQAMINPRGIDREFIELAEASGFFRALTSEERLSVLDMSLPMPVKLMHHFGESQTDGGVEFSDGQSLDGNTMQILRKVSNADVPMLLEVDSGDDMELAAEGKGFTAKDIKRVANLVADRNLRFCLDYLFGGPNCTVEGMHRSMQLAVKAGATSVVVSLGQRIYPRTRLAALTQGKLWENPLDLLPVVGYPLPVSVEQVDEVLSQYAKQVEVIRNY